MASQGPNGAGTGADGGTGTHSGTAAWVNPGNITVADGTPATVALSSVSQYSHWLNATNFGFSIPAGTTINGVLVEILRQKTGAGGIKDSSIRLILAGTVSGSDLATLTAFPTSYAYQPFGGSSSLWGLTLAATDINNSGFGVAFEVVHTGGLKQISTADVDYVRITVTYTAASNVPHRRIGSVLR